MVISNQLFKAKERGGFILAIEVDSFLSRNRARFVSVINMVSLALPPDVTW